MNISEKIKNAKFLIFDVDGTIADTSELHESAFKKVFKPFLVPLHYKELAGKNTKDAVELILKKNNLNLKPSEIEKLVSKKQLYVREAINSSTKFKSIPFAEEFIKDAHPKYQMGIASSGSKKTIELVLKRLNLYDYFNPILCSEDVKESKPSPEIFLKICKLKNIPKEECLIFEDSQNGIKASQDAKMPYVDITVHPFSFLLKKIRNL